MPQPVPPIDKLERTTYVQVWSSIVEALSELRELVSALVLSSDTQLIAELRKKFRTRLDELRTGLTTKLGKSEAYELLLPIVLYCDEIVLNKLPKAARPAWPLLQTELFQLNDGGERFFQLADEKLAQTQAPMLLLEVLYYCLGRGFLGRYLGEPAKVLPYKAQLAERLQLLAEQQRPSSQYRRAERKARRPETDPTAALPGAHLPLAAPLLLYLATFLLVFAVPLVLFALSNLRLVEDSPSEVQLKMDGTFGRESCRGIEQPSPRPEPAAERSAKPASTKAK